MAPKGSYNYGTRIQALTLLQEGKTIDYIKEKTKYSKSTIYDLLKKAKSRGYDPNKDSRILLVYVEDSERIGRPKKLTEEVKEAIISTISKNSTAKIAALVSPLVKGGISDRSVHRALRRRGYKPLKPTKKPGLTEANKVARLKWCLEHQDWTLEDWKNVIWSDETSVTWGGQRGRIRVWRTSSEAYNCHYIRRRWKGFKEFMFWACFSWHGKGPCHIWDEETEAEKKEAKK